MAILTIARLTLREASRRRLLLAIAILTIVVGLLSAWGFHRLLDLPCGTNDNSHRCATSTIRVVAATLLIMLMFMFSFILALGAAFLAAPSIAADVESGIMLAMLPRPIRRSDIILGKWLGLVTIVGSYAAVACGLEFVIIRIAMNYTPPHPVLVILSLVAEAAIILTLTLAASTRIPAMTAGIIVLVLFGMSWMGGIAGSVGTAFHSKPIETVGTVSSLLLPTDGMWREAVYNLEPVSLIVVGGELGREASGNPFFVTAPPPTAYLLWTALWVAAMLGLAAWSFHRRQL